MRTSSFLALSLLTAIPTVVAQSDSDRDGDGLSDFHEQHKYRTDPDNADSDGDGTPDGDWLERREYQYVVRTIVQVMRPVTIEFLNDDHQDARVLDETDTYVELEVVHYPFTTVASAIVADPDWRETTKALARWTEPGTTSDWDENMREQLLAELREDGIDAGRLSDKKLVEQASDWLCRRAEVHRAFTTFCADFDDAGNAFVPDDLQATITYDRVDIDELLRRDVSARGMFERKLRGTCTSTAIYLSGSLRALGIPTRTILTIPLVDANDERELELVARGIEHHELRAKLRRALRPLVGSWASHTFNEVYVGGRWRRLNGSVLGQDIFDAGLFGLLTHVATFDDWADAGVAHTIGARRAAQAYDDLFGGPNPYSTIAVRDEFGRHCAIDNPEYDADQLLVTAVSWGGGPSVPQDIRTWFHERPGLVARVDNLTGAEEWRRFVGEVDTTLSLTSPTAPPLEIEFHAGAWWNRGDHAWVALRPARDERGTPDPHAQYRVSQVGTGNWRVAEGVSVLPPALASQRNR